MICLFPVLSIIVWGVLSSFVINSAVLLRVWTETNINRIVVLMLLFLWCISFLFFSFFPNIHSIFYWMILGSSLGIFMGNVWIHIRLRKLVSLNISFDVLAFLGVRENERIQSVSREASHKLREFINDGKRLRAWLLFFTSPRKILKIPRERTVCLVRLYFAHRLNKRVIKMIDRFNSYKNANPSERLCSLKAQALRCEWRHGEALNCLRKSGEFYNNPHLLANGAMICHDIGDFDKAIEYIARAHQLASDCHVVWNNLAYYKIEKILVELNQGDWRDRLSAAVENSFKDFKDHLLDKVDTSEIPPPVLDTIGYLNLLKGTKYGTINALRIFISAMFVNTKARYHLALIRMIGTQTYFYPEILLKTVLRQSRLNGQRSVFELAERNLEKIIRARKDKIQLLPDSIYYHHMAYESLPQEVIFDNSIQRHSTLHETLRQYVDAVNNFFETLKLRKTAALYLRRGLEAELNSVIKNERYFGLNDFHQQ
jgi:hypothetical protein